MRRRALRAEQGRQVDVEIRRTLVMAVRHWQDQAVKAAEGHDDSGPTVAQFVQEFSKPRWLEPFNSNG
jgi:hypothetical protein